MTTVSQEAREARIEHLRAEIERCDKAIAEGTADNWWHIDRDRFRQELDNLTEPRHRQSAERGEVVAWMYVRKGFAPAVSMRDPRLRYSDLEALHPLYTLPTPPEAA